MSLIRRYISLGKTKKAKTLSASANSSHKDYYTTKETESEQGEGYFKGFKKS